MADQAFTAGTFYGATVALTTAATILSTSQAEMVKWTGFSREAVETTHLASGGKTFIVGDIPDWGEVEVTTKYSTQLQHATLMTGTVGKPMAEPRPVVNTMMFDPPAARPVSEAGS